MNVPILVVALAGATGATCGGTSPKPATTGDSSAVTPKGSGGDETPDAVRAQFRLFAFARVLGTIAPCGCTTEPLGGLQYAFGHIESSTSATQRLVLEPGSFLYPYENGPEWPTDEASWGQAHDRAKLLQTRFAELGSNLVSGIGPTDVISPKGLATLGDYPLPRVAANVALPEGAPATPPFRLVELVDEGITWKVAVTAVVDPALPGAAKLGGLTPAVPAAKTAIEKMKAAGADFNVVLAQGTGTFAQAIAKQVPDVGLVVAGIPEGVEQERLGGGTRRIGNTFIVEPGARLQTVMELRVSVDPKTKAVASVDAWTVATPSAALKDELARVEARLSKFKADPSADASFLAQLESERDRIAASLEQAPSGDTVAVVEPLKVSCKLPEDAAAKSALSAYDAKVAGENKARFTGVKAPAPAKGESGYVGIDACNDCHEEAVTFWKTTVHASAYKTLVDDNKQFDLSCVGCHVTGFRKPGGSEVVENAGLVDVQCEVCHGPGSGHVDDGGNNLALIKLEAPASLCATECHTEEHSDTFAYEAYLRDIVGPGHAEALRKKLGDGPTGHELRAAGLAKAGGCKKM